MQQILNINRLLITKKKYHKLKQTKSRNKFWNEIDKTPETLREEALINGIDVSEVLLQKLESVLKIMKNGKADSSEK